MSLEEFDRTIYVTRGCMKLMGVWPDSEKYRSSVLKFFISFFIMTFFIIIPQTTNLYFVKNNLSEVIEILTYAELATFAACCKLYNGWINRQAFGNLLSVMMKDWAVTEKDKRYEMQKDQKLVRFMAIFILTSIVGSTVFYTIVKMISINSIPENDILSGSRTKPFFLSAKFIFDFQSSPYYEIICFGQFLAGTVMSTVYGCYEGLFIILIFHACSQLNILKSEINNLVSQSKEKTFASLLKLIVDRHFQLKRFSTEIEKLFNLTFMIQITCISIALCLQGHQLIVSFGQSEENDIVSTIFNVVYIFATLFILAVNCFVAEKLRIESAKIFEAVYKISWYELKVQDARMLIIIMTASKAPFQLTAGKFAVLSVEYFMIVLKTAAGYLSILRAIKD